MFLLTLYFFRVVAAEPTEPQEPMSSSARLAAAAVWGGAARRRLAAADGGHHRPGREARSPLGPDLLTCSRERRSGRAVRPDRDQVGGGGSSGAGARGA